MAYKRTEEFSKSLIALTSLPQEDDLEAEIYEIFLRKILLIYKKPLDDVVGIVGDSCSVNQKLSANTNIALFGCTSHKLSLAIKKSITQDPELTAALDALQSLLYKLTTAKNLAKIRSLTHLGPTRPIETRWTRKFEMVHRYSRIKEHVRPLEELEKGMLTSEHHRKLKYAMKKFNRIQIISTNL